MQIRVGMAALATAALVALSAAAQPPDGPTATRENGVTVLRGTPGQQSTNSAAAADPTKVTPGLSGSTVNRGAFNAATTGSANAGGVIANPPPGAGQ